MICPHCGHSNLDGLDTCEECLHDLRTLDVATHTSDRMQVHLLEGKVAQIPYDRLVTVAPSDSLSRPSRRFSPRTLDRPWWLSAESLSGF